MRYFLIKREYNDIVEYLDINGSPVDKDNAYHFPDMKNVNYAISQFQKQQSDCNYLFEESTIRK